MFKLVQTVAPTFWSQGRYDVQNPEGLVVGQFRNAYDAMKFIKFQEREVWNEKNKGELMVGYWA